MFKRLFSSVLACICLAIVFSSCAFNPFFQGTNNNGAIDITTDLATYHSGDAIQVGVTNTYGNPVYAYNGRASCSILALSIQVGGAWVTSNAAPCAQQPKNNVIKLNPGQTYNTTIKGAFAAGSYRLSFVYSENASMVLSDNLRARNVAQSAVFMVSK